MRGAGEGDRGEGDNVLTIWVVELCTSMVHDSARKGDERPVPTSNIKPLGIGRFLFLMLTFKLPYYICSRFSIAPLLSDFCSAGRLGSCSQTGIPNSGNICWDTGIWRSLRHEFGERILAYQCDHDNVW